MEVTQRKTLRGLVTHNSAPPTEPTCWQPVPVQHQKSEAKNESKPVTGWEGPPLLLNGPATKVVFVNFTVNTYSEMPTTPQHQYAFT